MPQRLPPVTLRRATRLTVGRDQLLNLIETVLEPLAIAVSLWGVALVIEGRLSPQNMILSLIVFSLTFPSASRLTVAAWRVIRNTLLSWVVLSALLFVFGYSSGYLSYFDQDVLLTWWWMAPVSQVGAHFLLRLEAPAIRELQGHTKRTVLAGMNEQGVELAQRLATNPYSNVRVLGFFDDRDPERLSHRDEYPVLGKIQDLPAYVKQHHVDLIYVSLPMVSQPRILGLLDALRDTTASIYFVPDTFITDLIQGRMDAVSGIPVVAVCETPFVGMDGVIKRGSDILLSLLILLLISPLLLLIALAVKLTSPGPAIFKQRRYGLDGDEITVYKFRSMTALDDGGKIEQAHKGDSRVTPLGAFLRRTSLDELPQFFNVLQGRMSIVGPRPHAVAHNEMYRKLIKGYMQRHKVKPVITGWAQVNGYRG